MIFNQPFDGTLGEILINELKKDYTHFTIFSAFAKNSGVLRLKDAIDDFRAKGSGCVTAFIGVDLDGTSFEALENLCHMCDDLYIVHAENSNCTFHSKIYLLEASDHIWYAVGSNNLTGGGLWTNFESAVIHSLDGGSISCIHTLKDRIAAYRDESTPYSMRINSIDDIKELYKSGYIDMETAQTIRRREKKRKAHPPRKKRLFGALPVRVPTLANGKADAPGVSAANTPTQENTPRKDTTASTEEDRFWFEMRKSTGGSRNILDLSMTGIIQGGSAANTPYEIEGNSHQMYGGIKFFDIDPNDHSTEKNITINYEGRDYSPSTIKFAENNGSWRIQLKGSPVPDDGSEKLSAIGSTRIFVDKILIFKKITSDYYALSLADGSSLTLLKSTSRVWALNGSGASSKAYGML